MSDERPHLSISQSTMHARCELQWEFRYGMGIKSPPGVAAVIGRATHQTVEADLRFKMSWGSLLSKEEVQDIAAESARKEWENETPIIRVGDPDVGGAVDTVVSLAELHHSEVAPAIDPIAIEQAFKIEIPQLKYDVVGVVDIETETSIRDTKTSSKAPSASVALRSPQLAGYHLHSALSGRPDKSIALDYLVKTRTPYAVTIEAQPTAADHITFIDRIDRMARSLETGIFKPTNPDNWWCSEKWCGYWDRCRFGARKSVSVGLIDPAKLTSRIIPHPHRDDDSEAA